MQSVNLVDQTVLDIKYLVTKNKIATRRKTKGPSTTTLGLVQGPKD